MPALADLCATANSSSSCNAVADFLCAVGFVLGMLGLCSVQVNRGRSRLRETPLLIFAMLSSAVPPVSRAKIRLPECHPFAQTFRCAGVADFYRIFSYSNGA
jgi:hypothetical protein